MASAQCREQAIAWVLADEGGYSNQPLDRGGPTNMGITLATYRRFVDPDADVDDLRAMSEATAASLYREHYWDAVRGSELPCGVAYATFDFAVHSGVDRAVRSLQAVLGVTVDGWVGAQTLEAAARGDCVSIVRALCASRQEWLRTIATYKVFGNGWRARVARVERRAVELCAAGEGGPCRFCEWVRWLYAILARARSR